LYNLKGNQDGGEGFVGTIVEIGKMGSATSPDKVCFILISIFKVIFLYCNNYCSLLGVAFLL
jgi:hypothetical protein